MTLLLAAAVLFGITLVFATLLGIAKEKLRVQSYPYRPVIHCGAKTGDKKGVVEYDGVRSCVEANVVGVTQGCIYGCLGFGDCVASCNYGAMRMEDGLPVIDYAKCTGCGACVRACPRNIIESIPFKQERMLVIACSNKEPARLVKQVCTVGCVGCKMCQKLLADMFQIKDNLAYIDYEHYAGEEDREKVIAKCPADVMVSHATPMGRRPGLPSRFNRVACDTDGPREYKRAYSGQPADRLHRERQECRGPRRCPTTGGRAGLH
jgi:ferredoxin